MANLLMLPCSFTTKFGSQKFMCFDYLGMFLTFSPLRPCCDSGFSNDYVPNIALEGMDYLRLKFGAKCWYHYDGEIQSTFIYEVISVCTIFLTDGGCG